MTRRRVASASDLAPGQLRRVDVDGVPICLARTADGRIWAISDTCTHEETSLSEGALSDGSVECPSHGSLFDLETGAVTGMPATIPIRTYPVTLENGEVLIDARSEHE